MAALARAAGLAVVGSWPCERGRYDLHLLAPPAGGLDIDGAPVANGLGGAPSADGRADAPSANGRDGAPSASGGDVPPAAGGGGGGSPAPAWRDWLGLWRLWDAATLEVGHGRARAWASAHAPPRRN